MKAMIRAFSKVMAAIDFVLLVTGGDSGVQPARAQEESGLFQFIRTVEVTPDENFLGGRSFV